MIVVAHLRADPGGRGANWVGHVSLKEDNPSPRQIAQAAMDVIGSSMSVQEGDLIRVWSTPDEPVG